MRNAYYTWWWQALHVTHWMSAPLYISLLGDLSPLTSEFPTPTLIHIRQAPHGLTFCNGLFKDSSTKLLCDILTGFLLFFFLYAYVLSGNSWISLYGNSVLECNAKGYDAFILSCANRYDQQVQVLPEVHRRGMSVKMSLDVWIEDAKSLEGVAY